MGKRFQITWNRICESEKVNSIGEKEGGSFEFTVYFMNGRHNFEGKKKYI